MANRVALLGPNGQPMPSRNGTSGDWPLRDDGFKSKHVQSFSGIIGSISKTYRFTYDEALKRSVEDARAMRRDGFMTSLLKERIAPTGNSKYHLEPEDKNDVTQKWVTAAMTDIVADIPRFTAYRMQAMQAVWFGRYGNQIAVARKEVKGKPVWGIADHQPVNGDKIVFRHDGTPGVMISQMFARDYENQGATVGLADRGPVLFLDKPAWRERFLIHMHEAEDADFQEPELAGGIHGVGLRHWAFWIWWMRSETISWLLDYLGRVGAGGLTMIGYEQGNAAAKEAAEVVANDLQNGNIILCPMPIGSEKQTVTITRVEPSQVGSTVLIDIVDKFFESKLERLIVGQSMSGGADNADGLGGTGRSELAANTKFQLIKIDSQSLDETITEQLIKPLQRWNFPWAKWKTKFVSDLATPDPDKQLDAVQKAWEMGVSFDENEIRSLTGMAAPKPGDPVLKKSPETPQLPGMGAPGQPTPEQRAAQAIASVDGDDGDETDPDAADAKPEPGKGIGGERPKQYARSSIGDPEPVRYGRTAEPHKLSSTQINLPANLAEVVKAFAAAIPDDELADDEREDEPHITVKYGLHASGDLAASDALDVSKAVRSFGPVVMEFGKVSLFASDEHDVVKIDVVSPDLHRLNKLIADSFETTDTHSEYQPHITLAYVNPGCGEKYVGSDVMSGQSFVADAMTFSHADGKTFPVSLCSPADTEPPK